VQANLSKVTAAMTALRRWTRDRSLNPSETAYVARTRDRRQLRFSVSGDAAIDRAYRTHWLSPDLSERAVEQQNRLPDLVVIWPVKEWKCTLCGDTGELLFMEDAGPLCLDCADLGHLVFLPSGDAALTRRAKKASRLCAVVVRWSRSRKRYERQGILAEAEAIERAETSASPTPRCGLVEGSATKPDELTRTWNSRPSLPPRSAYCSPAAPSVGPMPSHSMRQRVAADGSGEPLLGGHSIRTPYGLPLRHRSATSTPTTTGC